MIGRARGVMALVSTLFYQNARYPPLNIRTFLSSEHFFIRLVPPRNTGCSARKSEEVVIRIVSKLRRC